MFVFFKLDWVKTQHAQQDTFKKQITRKVDFFRYNGHFLVNKFVKFEAQF